MNRCKKPMPKGNRETHRTHVNRRGKARLISLSYGVQNDSLGHGCRLSRPLIPTSQMANATTPRGGGGKNNTRGVLHGAYRPRSPPPSLAPFPHHNRQTSISRSGCLLEGNESGGGSTETGTTVTDGLVGDGELSEVVSGHLGLDLDGGERLSVLCGRSTGSKKKCSVISVPCLLPRATSPRSFRTHVNTTNGSNHLGDNDHVTQVSLDGRGLFVGSGLLLGLSKLLDQSKGLPLETSLEPSPRSGVDELWRGKNDQHDKRQPSANVFSRRMTTTGKQAG
jgi:hypothetical protein